MKFQFLFVILCLSVLLISYMTYNINVFMGNSLELKEINTSNKICHKVELETTIEDIVKINDNFLIGSSFRGFEVFNFQTYLKKRVENDHLYLFETDKEVVSKIQINNYPEEIPFHPHGMDLYKTNNDEFLLYIVNHAVDYDYTGEERIDVVKIYYNKTSLEPYLEYQKSFNLPKKFFLRINSVAVINKDIFYFTTYSPFPIPSHKNEISNLYKKIKYKFFSYAKSLMIMLNIKKCFVYSYNKGIINKIDGSESLFNNGIAFDKKRNYLYVIRTMEKDMNIFKIDQKDKSNAKFVKNVPTLYIGDNVYFDENEDRLYIGFAGQMSENTMIKEALMKYGNFDNVNAYSGYEEINPQNDYSISELMVTKNTFRGISSAIIINNKVYMVSIYTKGFYICINK